MPDILEQALLPISHEAEMAVLGSMLAEKEAMLKATDLLSEEDFYTGIHQLIFKSIRELQDAGVAADAITVGERLQRQEKLADVGGQAYLFELINRVPSALNVEHYARIVLEKSILRQMISKARKIAHDCSLQKEEAQKLLDDAQQLFFALSEAKSPRGMVATSQLMQTAISALEKLAENSKLVTGVPTGFTDLDKLTAGLQPANLVIVAGRPSMGKTALCLNMAAHAAIKDKKPVLFFSLEMSEQEMGLRLLCSEANINLREMREGILARKSWPAITNVASQIAGAPLY
ncbi:MAG: replicative DNA helicase, partial [Elusimicrobiota bacterium]